MTDKRKTRARLGLDARGRPRWEERVGTGEYRPATKGTEQTRTLKADELSLAETHRHRALSENPYANASVTQKPLKRRSRLDYMRALSEAIKTKRRVRPKGEE